MFKRVLKRRKSVQVLAFMMAALMVLSGVGALPMTAQASENQGTLSNDVSDGNAQNTQPENE